MMHIFVIIIGIVSLIIALVINVFIFVRYQKKLMSFDKFFTNSMITSGVAIFVFAISSLLFNDY